MSDPDRGVSRLYKTDFEGRVSLVVGTEMMHTTHTETQWSLFISYNSCICPGRMHCHYILPHAIRSHNQSSCHKLPSVLNIFRRANDRMNGRAPKSSSKAIEYGFLKFDLDAGTKISCNLCLFRFILPLQLEYKASICVPCSRIFHFEICTLPG